MGQPRIMKLDKHFFFEYCPHLSVVVFLAAIIVYIMSLFYGWYIDYKIIASVLGGTVAFFYFFQENKLEDFKVFREAFKDFNARFEEISDDLNGLTKTGSQPFTHEEEVTLNKYLDLCCEEYYFKRKGYIYPEVGV